MDSTNQQPKLFLEKFYLLFPIFFTEKISKNFTFEEVTNFPFTFVMLKLTKTRIFPYCQVPNGFFVNLIIQKFKFWKSDQLFIVSVSLVRGFFEGMRQNILYIFWAKVVYWKMNLTYLLANSWTRLVFFIPCITLYRLEKNNENYIACKGSFNHTV